MTKLYSYDIFDTVITRKVATPHGIFELVQRELIQNERYNFVPKYIRENFFDLRIKSEEYARTHLKKSPNSDISIDDIYYAMNMSSQVELSYLKELIQLEEKIEIDNVLPIKHNIAEIKRLISQGMKVVLISDMYLPKTVISEMLRRTDAALEGLELFVSCECGYTKSSNTLYGFVREIEHVEYDEWEHVGDHPVSDVSNPAKLGIISRPFCGARLLNIEKDYIARKEKDINSQYLIGLSRKCRIDTKMTSAAYNVGSSLGGILLTSYAMYIVDTALAKGIKNLFFIARDGFVIKKLVDVVIAIRNCDIRTKYIYGSRKVWRVPSIDLEEGSLFELFQASASKPIHTIKELAHLFGLTEEEVLSFLPYSNKWKGDFSFVDISLLVRYLEKETNIKSYLMEKNKDRREMVSAYLKEQINGEEGKMAFVEIGGTGYTQKCLEKIMRDFYDDEVMTFYFYLYGKHKYICDNSYIFLPGEYKCKDAIEPLCRALHGQTISYRRSDNFVEPVFDMHSDVIFEKCKYKEYIAALKDYASNLAKEQKSNDIISTDLEIVNGYWDYFVSTPDDELLNFIGEVPFDTDGLDGDRVYAPILDAKEIEKIKREGVSKNSWYYNGEWSFNFTLLRMREEDRQEIVSGGKHIFPTEKYIKDEIVHLPLSTIDKYEKIIVYGAGRFGRQFVKSIESQGKEIVRWLDKEYIYNQQHGINVSSHKDIPLEGYDCIIVAVVDEKIAREIAVELCNQGVDREKILWFSPKTIIDDWRKSV